MPNDMDDLAGHFNELSNTLKEGHVSEDALREEVENLEESINELGKRREGLGDEVEEVLIPPGFGPTEEEEQPSVGRLPKVPDFLRGAGLGKAAGDIGDRRMVIMPKPEKNVELDMLGVLKDIASAGLPIRGAVLTKAVGSKL